MNLTLQTSILDFGFPTIKRHKGLTPIINSSSKAKAIAIRRSPISAMNNFDPAYNSFILKNDNKKDHFYRV